MFIDMLGERGGLQGSGWRPAVRPDCCSAGWRPHVMSLMQHVTGPIFVVRMLLFCIQMTKVMIVRAVTTRLRHPTELNLI